MNDLVAKLRPGGIVLPGPVMAALDTAMECVAKTKHKVLTLEARLSEYEDREQVAKAS